jgi:ADP-ribose pyrophosphatase YjhB (NUDIX family)
MVMDSYGKWAFPKGHARSGEVYEKTALREISEEIGLSDLKCIAKLGTIDIWFRDRFVRPGLLVHKYIYYFLFEAPTDAVLHLPQAQDDGENIRDVAWVASNEVFRTSSYRDMIPIIKKAFAICGLFSSKTSKPWAFPGRPWKFRKDTR